MQAEDVEQGSDSSGNEWTLGGLAEDDSDSELDSDNAFGSSDEERFEGFVFRGSSSGKGKNKPAQAVKRQLQFNGGDQIDLDDHSLKDGETGEDDFGEDGVDLATMLDDENEKTMRGKDDSSDRDDQGSATDDESSTSQSNFYDEDEELGKDDGEKIARMADRLEALDDTAQLQTQEPQTEGGALSVDDLLADLDPSIKKQFSATLKTRKNRGQPTKLAPPLPKCQQDILDRQVATRKAKEQLDRWRDTVMHNRRSDLLKFPLKDPDQGEPEGKENFVDLAPRNELEKNIRKIMEDSGMVATQAHSAEDETEDAIMQAEGMQEQRMPVEQVMRRRAELRRTRDLLFREEIKAMRIAKIKSKSYRRVHRKERRREAERMQNGLEPPDEAEVDKADRKRAEERMRTKHRDSKWAKALKQTNRTLWDMSARDGANEDARRREELKRRILGREPGSDGDGSNDDSGSSDDETVDKLKKLDRLQQEGRPDEERGIAAMKFMRAAKERRKAQNDEDVERMRKELAGEDGEEQSDDAIDEQGLGRAIFGPKTQQKRDPGHKRTRRELEEGDTSEVDDEEPGIEVVPEDPKPPEPFRPRKTKSNSGNAAFSASRANCDGVASTDRESHYQDSSWLTDKPKKLKQNRRDEHEEIVIDTARTSTTDRPRPPKTSENPPRVQASKGPSAVDDRHDSDDADSEPLDPMLQAQEKQELLRRAFAGDDAIEATFAAEKAQDASDEDEKEVSNHLPGWGSWAGAGLSKSTQRQNARQRHNPLYKTKLPGIRKGQRKDARLENVVISEKGDRKAKKYLASVLPRGFEKKEQYESSLRLPLGPEWTTKETFQSATRPRVLVKPGTVISAMEKPMI